MLSCGCVCVCVLWLSFHLCVINIYIYSPVCSLFCESVCPCVCLRACVRACVCVCVCVCVSSISHALTCSIIWALLCSLVKPVCIKNSLSLAYLSLPSCLRSNWFFGSLTLSLIGSLGTQRS